MIIAAIIIIITIISSLDTRTYVDEMNTPRITSLAAFFA